MFYLFKINWSVCNPNAHMLKFQLLRKNSTIPLRTFKINHCKVILRHKFNWEKLVCRNLSNISRIKKKSELGRLFGLAKPERVSLISATVLLIISSSVTMSLPFCMGKIIDIMYTSPADEIKGKLNAISQILIIVFLIGASANFGRSYLMNVSGQRIINRLRTILYDNILKQEIGFFDKVKTGELINRLSSDTTVVGYSVTTNISDGLRSTIAVLIGVGMMTYTSTELAFVGLSIVPPVALGAVFYGRYTRNITRSVQDSLAQATQVAEERIGNIRTVRANACEQVESVHYSSQIENVFNLAKKESLARAIFFGTAGLSGNVIIITVIYYGGTMMSNSLITVGELGAFLMYAAYVGISLGGLSSFYSETMRALGASTRLWQLTDRKPQIPISGGIKPKLLMGNVQFKNVSFSYPNRPDALILKDFTLEIFSGNVIAVVGASGSGKSTIAALLLRFYDAERGHILIDGLDIKELDPHWLRKNSGLVSQEPVLFSGTIEENIIYGAPDSISNLRLKEVAEEANAWEFIQGFPEKLNTLVGERGVMLSGGQKQRIAIARALIKDPKILILDEATSALDAGSEYLVQEALERLMVGRTVITIAHRLSTILKANRIAVLDKGRVAEFGSYNELMTIENGKFRSLVEKQMVQN